MKLLPNDSRKNVVSNVIPKWGLGPRLIFGGLKTTERVNAFNLVVVVIMVQLGHRQPERLVELLKHRR